MSSASIHTIANACEDYVDQLRRLRGKIISDPSVENGKKHLQSALESLQICAKKAIAGVTGEVTADESSESIWQHSSELQNQHALHTLRPMRRVGFANCSAHLKTLAEHYASGGNQAAADVLFTRVFGSMFGPYNFSILSRNLRQEKRIAVAPLATDAFLLSLVQEFHRRIHEHASFPMGIAATNPHPRLKFFSYQGSHCLLPDIDHKNCIVLTDIDCRGTTRSECLDILQERYPTANVVNIRV